LFLKIAVTVLVPSSCQWPGPGGATPAAASGQAAAASRWFSFPALSPSRRESRGYTPVALPWPSTGMLSGNGGRAQSLVTRSLENPGSLSLSLEWRSRRLPAPATTVVVPVCLGCMFIQLRILQVRSTLTFKATDATTLVSAGRRQRAADSECSGAPTTGHGARPETTRADHNGGASDSMCHCHTNLAHSQGNVEGWTGLDLGGRAEVSCVESGMSGREPQADTPIPDPDS
jgi:hypothetical protein